MRGPNMPAPLLHAAPRPLQLCPPQYQGLLALGVALHDVIDNDCLHGQQEQEDVGGQNQLFCRQQAGQGRGEQQGGPAVRSVRVRGLLPVL